MHMKKILKLISAFLFLDVVGASCFANGFETWTEKMTCGEVQYKLESVCKKSNDEMVLNECKSQSLEITNTESIRKVDLPELNKYHASLFKEVGGNLREIFLVQWGCGQADGVSEAIFYYSTGGGSAANSETSASYDEIGALIEDQNKKNPNYAKALKDARKHMKKIHSIMPD